MRRIVRWLLTTRLGRIAIVLVVVVGVPAGWLAWWLASPLFIDRVVEEEFPYAVDAVVPEEMTMTPAEVMELTRGASDDDVTELLDRMADGREVTEGMSLEVERTDVEMIMEVRAGMEEPASDAMPQDASGEAVALLRGEFHDADGFHKGSGQATLYRLPDGSQLLRLENFNGANGPDLRVILSEHPDPGSRSEFDSRDYVELGKLKGNIGNQNYPVPSGVDASQYRSVVIYCKPFHVLFTIAPLMEP